MARTPLRFLGLGPRLGLGLGLGVGIGATAATDGAATRSTRAPLTPGGDSGSVAIAYHRIR